MSTKPTDSCYIFIIDTDKYSGNFERELCAYVTGVVGDCEVGIKFTFIFHRVINIKENKFNEIIKQVPDEHGCYRPVSIWETPGWGNSGMGLHEIITPENKDKYPWPAYQSVAIFFNEKPNKEMIDWMKSRALIFAKKYGAIPILHELSVPEHEELIITGFRLINYKINIEEIEEKV